MRPRFFTVAALLPGLLPLAAVSAQAAPPPLDRWLEHQVGDIEARAASLLADPDWSAQRLRLRAQLFEMLGLVPRPPRGELRAAVTGVVEHGDIAVERLHFRSLPGLYVTANLHRPRKVSGRLPVILYLCGHGRVKKGGVSYGNKARYQHHAVWFARHGYVCLILDTLQLGEIAGLHAGTLRLGQWWWVSRGYTPAGVEAWNAIRALDYLATRDDVDMERLGVTGRSGGGIGTWMLAALDDRPEVLAPVAGLTDLRDHVLGGAIRHHCDCNFPINRYRWDYSVLAALSAPRPLLFCNSDRDSLFPLSGVQRVHAALRRLYDRLGASDHLGLVITPGPHGDNQALRVPVFRWMERWLRGHRDAVVDAAEPVYRSEQLRVFDHLPDDRRNEHIQEQLVPLADVPPPADRQQLAALQQRLTGALRAGPLHWLRAQLPAGELAPRVLGERDGRRLVELSLLGGASFPVPLDLILPAEPARLRLELVPAADRRARRAGWQRWLQGGPAPGGAPPPATAVAWFAPRELPAGSDRNDLRRRCYVVGRTWDDGRIEDAMLAIHAAGRLLGDVPCELLATGDLAGVALHAAVLEPAVSRLDLRALPPSYDRGPYLLGVRTLCDVPQTLALVFPRRVVLRGVDSTAFAWSARAAALYPEPPLRIVGG